MAQPISWKESSGKTFVCKLSGKEVLSIFKGYLKKEKLDKILNSPFDSFSANWAECPVEGLSLFATVEKNKVNYSYYPIIPFHVFLFKEYGVLTLQVVDAEGNIREDAKVRLGHHSKFIHLFFSLPRQVPAVREETKLHGIYSGYKKPIYAIRV